MEYKKIRWRRLDASAKLFPFISNKKLSSVFRISVVLKERIKPEILEKALNQVLVKHPSFKVMLRRGFFWYYFEQNTKDAKIEIENTYPCQYIEKRKTRGYPFRVSYYEKKINLEVFHSLTDANTATKFLKELTYEYIELKKNVSTEKRNLSNEFVDNVEDSYLKNYDKEKNKSTKLKKAYNIQGKRLPFGARGVLHFYMDLESVKKVSKVAGATITEYLTAVLAYSIYLEKHKKNKAKRPIIINIPVDMKKFYKSQTALNFFLFVTITVELNPNKTYEFSDFLRIILSEFDKRLTHDKLENAMTSAVKTGSNIFTRITPMPLKKVITHMTYVYSRRNITTTLSNIGNIKVLDEYKKEIDTFLFIFAPDNIGNTKCSLVSYGDKIIFSFTSLLADCDIEKRFYQILKEKNIKIKVEGNGVYEFIS